MHTSFHSTSTTTTSHTTELGPRTTSYYGRTVAFIGGVGVSAMAYFNAFKVPTPDEDADRVLRAFEEGRGLEKVRDHVVDVDRTKLERQLSAIMQRPVLKKYVVVVGRHGTGKTTVIKGALSALPSPKGAIYTSTSCCAGEIFTDLAVLLGFMDLFERKYWLGKDAALFNLLIPALQTAAAKFKAKHGRPAVLVIDGTDYLVKREPEVLRLLHALAKESADVGNLRIVFVDDDGSKSTPLISRNAWSRAAEPFEIGEIPDDQAVDFLVKSGVDADYAKRVVDNLTGGLIVALNQVSGRDTSSREDQYNKDLESRNDHVRGLIRKAGALSISKHAVFRELVRDGRIDISRPADLGMSKAQMDALLAAKVLYECPNATYIFYNRRVASWFRAHLKNA